MSDTHGKFIWYELMTPDTEAAARFYGFVVGWTAAPFENAAMPYTIFETNGRGVGGMMELTDEFARSGIPPNWTGYVAVDNVDETVRKIDAEGGSIMRPAEDIPEVGRFAVVKDPDGAVLCIMTPLPMDNQPPEAAPDAPGHVGWSELFTDDVERASTFYGSVFGWTKDHDMDMGEMGPYRIFAYKGKAIGGMMKRLPQVPVCHWGYYFNVDAIDQAVTRVSTGGGQVINGPMEVPGGSWIVNCLDPHGAYFSLVAPRK
jgi:predicted enzyme related to lactoylglutathione lyase